MKVSFFTTWNTRCGIAYYSKYLVDELKKLVDVEVCRVDPAFTKEEFCEAAKNCSGDIAIFQHEWSIYNGHESLMFSIVNEKKIPIVLSANGGNHHLFLGKVAKIIVYSQAQRGTSTPETVLMLPGATCFKKLEKEKAKELLGITKPYVVTQFGFILPHKHYELVLHALKDRDDVCYLIAGSEERNIEYWLHLEKLIKDWNVKAEIIKTGFVPDEKIPVVFSATDLCVFPYVLGVGSGPMRDALANKVLSLGSPVPFIQENFSQYGIPYISKDPWDKNFKLAIYQLLKKEDLTDFEARCERFAREHSWEIAAKNLFELCRQVLEPKKTSLLLDHLEKAFILELRELFKGTLFIDVGANAGYYAINLADKFDEVWAIEPYKVFVDQLRANIKRFNISNIKVIEKAISDRSGIAPFYGNVYVPLGRDSPSLKQILTLGFDDQKTLPLEMEKVETTTLSDLIGNREVDLIKVDTEGNEKDILWGSQKAMHQIKAWHIEAHDWNTIPEITNLLEFYGFKVRERGMNGRAKGWLLARK